MKAHRCSAVFLTSAFCAGAVTAAAAQAAPELRLTRELRIDAAEHDLTLMFPPGGLAVAPNGTIVVSQHQDGVLRFFDAQGRPSGSFGRKGQGPGEFQLIARFFWMGDTLVVGDGNTRRFTLVSPDRKLVRTVPYLQAVSKPEQSTSTAQAHRVGIARLLFPDHSQLVSATFADGAPIPDWLGKSAPGMLFFRADSSGALRRVFGWAPNATSCRVVSGSERSGLMVLTVPFCAIPLEDAGMGRGRLALVYAEEGTRPAYRVSVFNMNGDTVFSRSYSFQRIPVPKADKDTAIAARNRGDAARRALVEKMQLPEFFPPFSRLLVGRDETTWLELPPVRDSRTWQVLDARGNVTGSVNVPRNTTIMVASREMIWAIETDDDGLQHIVRYRVTR
jgi:hypothetical protein